MINLCYNDRIINNSFSTKHKLMIFIKGLHKKKHFVLIVLLLHKILNFMVYKYH